MLIYGFLWTINVLLIGVESILIFEDSKEYLYVILHIFYLYISHLCSILLCSGLLNRQESCNPPSSSFPFWSSELLRLDMSVDVRRENIRADAGTTDDYLNDEELAADAAINDTFLR